MSPPSLPRSKTPKRRPSPAPKSNDCSATAPNAAVSTGNGFVPLIAFRSDGAVVWRGMVVLVIRQLLARAQIALGDAGRVAIGGAQPDPHRADRIEADVLDHEIAQRRGVADRRALVVGPRDTAGQPQRCRGRGKAEQRADQKCISYSSCPRSVRRGAAGVKPKRIPAFHFSEPGPSRTTEPKSCGPMRWSCAPIGEKCPIGPGVP